MQQRFSLVFFRGTLSEEVSILVDKLLQLLGIAQVDFILTDLVYDSCEDRVNILLARTTVAL